MRTYRKKQQGTPITPTEMEVARLAAEDLADKQIADRLGVSQKTVEAHLLHLRQRLGVRSKIGVAVWAVKQQGAE